MKFGLLISSEKEKNIQEKKFHRKILQKLQPEN